MDSSSLGERLKVLKSPQATRISESGGRTESHTSNLIDVSHPSSSTSSGGVYPKAAHSGPPPCEAECPEESKGLHAVLCPSSWASTQGPQAPAGSRNIPLALGLLTIGEDRASSGAETAQAGADTWLWGLCNQKILRGTLRRMTFQMSEGWVRSLLQEVSSGVWYTGLGDAMTKSGKNQAFKYLWDTDPRTECDRPGIYLRSETRCNERKKNQKKSNNFLIGTLHNWVFTFGHFKPVSFSIPFPQLSAEVELV